MKVRNLNAWLNLIRSVDVCTLGYNNQRDNQERTDADRNLPHNAAIKSRVMKRYGGVVKVRNLDAWLDLIRSVDVCTLGYNNQRDNQERADADRNLPHNAAIKSRAMKRYGGVVKVRNLDAWLDLIRSVDVCTLGYNNQRDNQERTDADRNLPHNAAIKSRAMKRYGGVVKVRNLDAWLDLIRSVDVCTLGYNNQRDNQERTDADRNLPHNATIKSRVMKRYGGTARVSNLGTRSGSIRDNQDHIGVGRKLRESVTMKSRF